MPANRLQLQKTLHQPYDRLLFAKEVLSPIFGIAFTLYVNKIETFINPTKSESNIIDKAGVYGKIILDDNTEITCYEIILQSNIKIGHSKIAIQQYVRKLLAAGQAAFINFVAPNDKNVWRLTFVAKDSILTDDGIKEKVTNAKRYTYLLGPGETCRTAAERFEELSTATKIDFDTVVKAFSVEKLSKSFFDEYTHHYKRFVEYLTSSNYKTFVFKNDEKSIRDFTKKLLGRIVFLYFVQKKGWLGASTNAYADGDTNFIFTLFRKSGGDGTFYPNWLSVLFFETLNQGGTQNPKRKDDDFIMPDGKLLKIPFLNGGLFDKDAHDEYLFTFKPILFHNPDNEDDPKHRGFLDFLNAFNFTVFEDSPDDHTIAVDPEMLGHIFENLLEDNKDKGAFYTPKEIVHFMCQESLIEYLCMKCKTEVDEKLRDGLDRFIKNQELRGVSGYEEAILVALRDVKICDPAIGSGAFPMGILLEIFHAVETFHYNIKDVTERVWGLESGWDPAKIKLSIIENSIYGVDVESGAVDIARLRFWLSLVVDEAKPQPLPNLDYKIVVGNSLVSKFEDEIIDIDWEVTAGTEATRQRQFQIHDNLNKLLSKQKQFFSYKRDKKILQSEIRNLKIDVLISQLELDKYKYDQTNAVTGDLFEPHKIDKQKFVEIQARLSGYQDAIKKLESLKKTSDRPLNFFDWKLNFPEVLNPVLKSKGDLSSTTGFDIVIGNPPYNLEANVDLKKEYKRKFITLHFKINLFACFIEQGYFLCKDGAYFTYIVPNLLFANDSLKLIRKLFLEKTCPKFFMNLGDNIFENATVPTMIFGVIKTVTTYNNFKVYPCIDQINNGSFFLQENQRTLKNYNYVIETSNPAFADLLKKIDSVSTKLETFLAVNQGIITGNDKKFLSNKRENSKWKQIVRGKDIAKYYTSYPEIYVKYDKDELACPRTVDLFESDEKLLMRRTGDFPMVSYDNQKSYNLHTLYSCRAKSDYPIKILLGLLNSNLLKFIYQQKLGTEIGRTFAEIKILYIRQLPVFKDFKKLAKLIPIIDKIIEIKTNNPKSDTNILENEIDGLVYKSYGLTHEEVIAIDTKYALNRNQYDAIK